VIVVDTNVLVYFYLPSDHPEKAEAVLTYDHDWVVPVLWRSEFRNVLTKYLRLKTLSFQEIVDIQSEVEFGLSGQEYSVDSRQVLQLVADSNCSSYDCEFVALAIQLKTKLATMDKKVLRSFPNHTIDPAKLI
jgi:predicted nucleic acid-binding protein